MKIFQEVKIKYSLLNELLEEKINNIKFSSYVNILVDLKEIFKKIFRPGILNSERCLSQKNIEEISSDIIGIVSHYRNYFYKHGKYTNFYFFYSKKENEYFKNINKDYKKSHYEKYYTNSENLVILKNKVISVIEKFFKVVPNVNFIDSSTFEDFSLVYFLKTKIKENELSLMLSNDPLWLLNCNEKNLFALNCKGLNSSLISFYNLPKYIIEKDVKNTFSSCLFPLVLSISGVKQYSLDGIKGIGINRSVSIVKELLEKNKLVDNNYLYFPLKKEDLDEKNKSERILKDNFEIIKNNYTIIQPAEFIFSNNLEITTLFNEKKNVISKEKFLEINSKLFNNFPIELDMLLKGEKI